MYCVNLFIKQIMFELDTVNMIQIQIMFELNIFLIVIRGVI